MESQPFQFNRHNVCENPKVVFQHVGKKVEIAITVAEDRGRWDWGRSFGLKFGGFSGGGGLPWKDGKYVSEEAAIKAACLSMLKWIDHEREAHESLNEGGKWSDKIFEPFYQFARQYVKPSEWIPKQETGQLLLEL